MSTKRSRVHPPYKTKYRVTNWASYNKRLVDRGNLRLWISPDAIASWNTKPSERRRGGQPKYSNLAIETVQPAIPQPVPEPAGVLEDLAALLNRCSPRVGLIPRILDRQTGGPRYSQEDHLDLVSPVLVPGLRHREQPARCHFGTTISSRRENLLA